MATAVVLGGGLAGLATARILERHYPRVLVLPRDPPGGASPGGAPCLSSREPPRPGARGGRLPGAPLPPAAIVVDATGRRSRAPEWLAALGAPAPYERSAETGIFYYTRFYRVRRGRAPRGTTGLVAGDLGWVKIAIFPGDGRTFSITVAAPVDDHSLRGLSDPAPFDRF